MATAGIREVPKQGWADSHRSDDAGMLTWSLCDVRP